ncbi:MAG: AMP-binding protein [Planctomycetota bacterium]|jgi:fatty-acyl-CoA synthase
MTQSYFHRGGDEPLLFETVESVVRGVAARHPDREAVVSLPQGVRLTYAALQAEADRLARGLLALGIEPGDRVAIWSTDNAEWIIVQLAVSAVGAVLVNINPAYRAAELEHALTAVGVRSLFLIPTFRSSDYVGMLRTLAPELDRTTPDGFAAARLPDLRHVVVWDPDDTPGTVRPAPGMRTWAEVLDLGEPVPDERRRRRAAAVDPDDPVSIQLTSGTTGRPKAVVLTHHGIVNNGRSVGQAMGFTEHDRLCVPVPFYHCFGMVVASLACLTHGAAIVIPSPHFEVGATLATIERERCTALHGVPTMFVAELECPDFDRYDVSSLRTGIMGGAPCPPALLRRVIEDMGCREILVAYGMTESSPLTHVARRDGSIEERTETVGTSLPHQEAKVVDPGTGRTVPLGTPGELCFRGYHVMKGYDGDPAATAEAIDGAGWLHSGDIGVMGEGGTVRITGRLKDMIIRGGENIYPAEVEAIYFEHPDVENIAVFGVPDERLGEEVAAWVQLHEGAAGDAEALREWGRGRMAHFKVPRLLRIVDEFPMTATGKIQKFRIREIAAGQMQHAP